MESPAIQTRHLGKHFGRVRALHDVSLQVMEGEIFGFLGPNGAGKTTTIKLLLNFLQPSTGSLKVLGLDPLVDSVAINKKIGFLAGDLELYDNLTAKQYLDFIMQLKGLDCRERITELVVQLEANMKAKIRTLSRGNKQKIGLIAALMHQPDLLILDEPTSGLDPLVQASFNELMREHKASGKTVFISSHILSEVQQLCDRVAFMRQGKLVQTIDIASLLKRNSKMVKIVFAMPTEKVDFPSKFDVIDQTAKTLTARYHGEMNSLVSWISEYDIDDVRIEDADLEDMFIHLYEKTSKEETDV